MTKAQAEAAARLPVFTKRYYDIWNVIGRAFRLDVEYNCHTFIQKKNLITGRYIGGWSDFTHRKPKIKKEWIQLELF